MKTSSIAACMLVVALCCRAAASRWVGNVWSCSGSCTLSQKNSHKPEPAEEEAELFDDTTIKIYPNSSLVAVINRLQFTTHGEGVVKCTAAGLVKVSGAVSIAKKPLTKWQQNVWIGPGALTRLRAGEAKDLAIVSPVRGVKESPTEIDWTSALANPSAPIPEGAQKPCFLLSVSRMVGETETSIVPTVTLGFDERKYVLPGQLSLSPGLYKIALVATGDGVEQETLHFEFRIVGADTVDDLSDLDAQATTEDDYLDLARAYKANWLDPDVDRIYDLAKAKFPASQQVKEAIDSWKNHKGAAK